MSDRVAFKCPDCGETCYASVGASKGHGGGFNYPPEPDVIEEIYEYEFDCECDIKHCLTTPVLDDLVGGGTRESIIFTRGGSPENVVWWNRVDDLVYEGEIEWDDDDCYGDYEGDDHNWDSYERGFYDD